MGYDENWLCALVARRTKETWDRTNGPYYISSLGVDVKNAGADFSEIIGSHKLRQWAVSTKIPGVKVLTDRQHRAKVGFIPENESYEFEAPVPAMGTGSAEKLEGLQSRVFSQSRSRVATLRFLEALSTLPDEDLDGINIPVKTIVRLLAK